MVACLKVAAALERIGRYGKDIAGVVGHLAEEGAYANKPRLADLLSIPVMATDGREDDRHGACGLRDGDLALIQDSRTTTVTRSATRSSPCITYVLEDRDDHARRG